MASARLTPQQRLDLVARLKAGATGTEVAAEFGVTLAAVAYHAAKAGLPKVNGRPRAAALPAPAVALEALASSPEWKLSGNCTTADPDEFYPDKRDERTATRAKALCTGCPVKAQCLAEALSQHVSQDWGVWGGTTHYERRKMRTQAAKVAG
jgi:hypothetical protein